MEGEARVWGYVLVRVVIRRRRGRQRRLVAVTDAQGADGRGHGRLTNLPVAAVVVLLVMAVRWSLAEEGLHPSVPAAVQHDDLDDLLTLNERVGPQVGHAGGGGLELLLLEEEVVVVVGGGARR